MDQLRNTQGAPNTVTASLIAKTDTAAYTSLLSALYAELPAWARTFHDTSLDHSKHILNFQVVNILITMQNARIISTCSNGFTTEEGVAVAKELMDSLTRVPHEYLLANSVPVVSSALSLPLCPLPWSSKQITLANSLSTFRCDFSSTNSPASEESSASTPPKPQATKPSSASDPSSRACPSSSLLSKTTLSPLPARPTRPSFATPRKSTCISLYGSRREAQGLLGRVSRAVEASGEEEGERLARLSLSTRYHYPSTCLRVPISRISSQT